MLLINGVMTPDIPDYTMGPSKTRCCCNGPMYASHPPMYDVCPLHGKWAGERERYYDPFTLLDAAGKLKPPGEAMRAEDV